MQTDDLLLAIGEQVRRARAAQGISQERLAERAGIHRNYVGLIERGERNVSLGTMIDIAEALDLTLAELFAELPRRSPAAPRLTEGGRDLRSSVRRGVRS